MKYFSIILTIILFIFIFLEILFLSLCKEKERKIFKCFPLLTISILFLIIDYEKFYILSIIAFLYFLGDFLLLSFKKKLFFFGAISFAIGHALLIFYLFYKKIFILNFTNLIISLLFIIFFIVIFYLKMKEKMKSFVYGGSIYLSLLFFIFIYSLLEVTSYKFIFLSFGSLIYYVSDLLVIKERFIENSKYLNLLIMSLYYLANILIFSFLYIY